MYEIKDLNGHGAVYTSKQCLPSKTVIAVMYRTGCKMFKDGKRLTLEEAKAECGENSDE